MPGRRIDDRYMAAAIRLSRWHLGLTGSNPSVGCLIVRDGVIVGRGVTAKSGRPHAETQALAEAGALASGATAYVTLEPCSHHGKTPPCADALIASGIARVVVGCPDPDPRVSGRGIAMLNAAGIEVDVDVLREEAESELQAYLNRQRRKTPQVILKLAVSADGMVGRKGEGQLAITGPQARAQSHILRAESDAILVGIGTVLADDPELSCRLPGMQSRSPLRIVLDRDLALPLSSRLVQTIADGFGLLVVAGPRADAARKEALVAAGAEVLEAGGLDALLRALAERGISSLIVEGGAGVASRFLDEGLVDRIMLFQSDIVVGTDGIPAPITEQTVPEAYRLTSRHVYGKDRCLDYIRTSGSEIAGVPAQSG
ncbi:bifunctional diaminohydroxyphosphoribosylaminopyrimidine deaminase/5-amino-6-(5-phosphoribosylamino)uracil reductase RibD [Rhizobium alvei]|uniref:Riboflavin biosynthesis protein RibD n=1 Tax=Rhizobium alvei TaxID=1132659 RepID=A0ABT8YJG6_9HYPH|nr:bifunctional diaminohydroxyphosphoribosylaminopyrimidine deaminase/5-amino-6-(5-phosphoribosylamino)uracil reductase RibD [Rhizobium alvei]MDO6963776.1 bifunctional diaminohydroxyphosphoribosylaminopyrimidine deaminase/5-amino-6-(5-phosphoribosylamino)uracil reductase RibD [Rhizobium alvei]